MVVSPLLDLKEGFPPFCTSKVEEGLKKLRLETHLALVVERKRHADRACSLMREFRDDALHQLQLHLLHVSMEEMEMIGRDDSVSK